MIEEITKFLDDATIYNYEIIGDYYIGYCDMMFGVRVRAGRLFSGWCDIDVCCGEAQHLRATIKLLYANKMRINYNNKLPITEGLLTGSQNKPVFNDRAYMYWIGTLYTYLLKKNISFNIGYDVMGYAESIECLMCKKRSYNQEDIKRLYCGNCNLFHINNGE